MKLGIVSGRVALLLRSAEIKPLFDGFVSKHTFLPQFHSGGNSRAAIISSVIRHCRIGYSGSLVGSTSISISRVAIIISQINHAYYNMFYAFIFSGYRFLILSPYAILRR